MPELPPKKFKPRFEHHKLRATETEDGWSQIVRDSSRGGRRGELHAKKEERRRTDTGTKLTNQIRSLSIRDRGESLKVLEEMLTPAQQVLCLKLLRECHKGNTDVQGVIDPAEEEQAANRDDGAVEKLNRTFKRVSAEWKEEAGPTVEKSLMSRIPEFQHVLASTDNVICLGLGSLSDGDGLYNSMWQLVFLMDFIRLCVSCQEGKTRSDIEVYAQDPVFSATDRDFMHQVLGITVLKSPAAFERIKATSLVYAPHLPHLSWSKAMRSGVPALMIANNIEESLQHFINEEDLVELFNGLLVPTSSSSLRFVTYPHQNEEVVDDKKSEEVVDDKKSEEVVDDKKSDEVMESKKGEQAKNQAQELYVPDAHVKLEFEAFVAETHDRGTAFAFPVPTCDKVLSTAFYATQVYINKRFMTGPSEDEEKTAGE